MKIGIIDYGSGNLGSVIRVLEELSIHALLIQEPEHMGSADKYILPGVGNFTDCKERLDVHGWTAAISEEILIKEKPLLGICVGMQLLADSSTEGAEFGNKTKGLGFIKGNVVKLDTLGCSSRIPHMGWNEVKINRETPLLAGIESGTDFYFVHSYAFVSNSVENIIAVTDYGVPLTAVIGKNHIWGAQFHPEKSSRAGFKVLENFASDLC